MRPGWRRLPLPLRRRLFGTFIDWRGYPTIHSAAVKLGLKPLNLVIWTKTNAGPSHLRPNATGSVVVAYGSDGLTDNLNGSWATMIRESAEGLAAAGYIAIIPDGLSATQTAPGLAVIDSIHANRGMWQAALSDAIDSASALASARTPPADPPTPAVPPPGARRRQARLRFYAPADGGSALGRARRARPPSAALPPRRRAAWTARCACAARRPPAPSP